MAETDKAIDLTAEISRPSAAVAGYARVSQWGRRVGLGRKLSIALTVIALGFAFATYATITGSSPLGADTQTVLILLQIDLVLFLLLGLVVARSLVGLWIERRRGQVGSRLHMRLAMLFSLIALAPAIIVSVFSAVFFNFGMENWFNDRVKTAIVESRAVAEAYLKEHKQVIRGDVLSMARDLERALPLLTENPRQFSRILAGQGLVRNLSEIYVFDGSGRILAKWALGFVIDRDPVAPEIIERARSGEVVLLTSEADDRLRAIIKLDRFVDAFLYVGRFVEPRVLEHIDKTERAAAEYANIEGRRSSIEITFAMIFILVGMLLLFVAIWVGLVFANRLSRPISDLAGAAERVRAGDLSARVEEGPDSDELGLLSRAFNRMTDQLEGQRHELVQANRQLDERRHFIETVLGGVSAGVIGVDAEGRINLANRSACSLLAMDIDEQIGADISEVVPELSAMIGDAHTRPNRLVEAQISMQRVRRDRTLLVRLAADVVDRKVSGFVITFDDITELVAAQRKAAWSDVARRIAHEIKNPLTPIQLAAERLRRKYMNEITSDPETFSNCTDTIIRQVGDIGRMVDEFSAFARMPRPEMERENIGKICREALVLPRSAHPEIEFVSDIPGDPVMITGDSRQLSQVLTNLIQNAIDAIDGRVADGQAELAAGEIQLSLSLTEEDAEIVITDNGKGLPVEKRDRLTEPYMTTRTKGTGLGLAIVKTILEDHGAV
ncbi:MAG: PAS domain-containing sensor histidine kinase, partial [Rhodospirillaceae bacterium]|nr:PAS domain-containing sensor histidine kinase [Rhodospirillaceae bacterium]